MKQNYEEWRVLINEVNHNITHAEEQGLPLVSIELDPVEWELWLIARTSLQNGGRIPLRPVLLEGYEIYRGIKVYKGKS